MLQTENLYIVSKESLKLPTKRFNGTNKGSAIIDVFMVPLRCTDIAYIQSLSRASGPGMLVKALASSRPTLFSLRTHSGPPSSYF